VIIPAIRTIPVRPPNIDPKIIGREDFVEVILLRFALVTKTSGNLH
jgi:hypothetical protein